MQKIEEAGIGNTATINEELTADHAAQSADESRKQDFLWHTHAYLNEYARFADTKAAFAATLSAAFLGYLYNKRALSSFMTFNYRQWSLASWLAGGACVFLMICLGLAIWTIRPRLKSTQSEGFIYWSSIVANRDYDAFRSAFNAKSSSELGDHLLGHVYDISKFVCVPKYRSVSICMFMLVVGCLLGAASLLVSP